MSAIEASAAGFKDMADGTVRFFFDVEPRHAEAALRLFRARGTPAALAALKTAGQKQQEERAPGGAAARWLGIRCNDPAFQAWLQRDWPACWLESKASSHAERSADVVRAVLNVKSRAEIDNDLAVKERFDRLIRKPWEAVAS